MSPPSHSGHRPNVIDPPPGKDYDAIASDVQYEGSPYHKRDTPTSRPKANRTTLCPPRLNGEQELLSEWVAEAIRRRAVSGKFRGDYPSEVWYKAEDGQVYKGRITNQAQGTYHGFPIPESEWPQKIEECYV